MIDLVAVTAAIAINTAMCTAAKEIQAVFC
jgi:hypothetical protein